MSALLQAYRDQLDDFVKRKVQTATFDAPCCRKPIVSPRPPLGIEFPSKVIEAGPWSAVMECPHCGEHFHKTVHASGRVDAHLLAEEVLP
jgi:hypothetical protein